MLSSILLMIGMNELIIIFVIVLLLFGGKKIPELMKGVGKGVRSFKEGMNDISEEINKDPIEKSKDSKKDEPKKN